MNKWIPLVIVKVVFGATLALGFAHPAHAEEIETINLSDIHRVQDFPVCVQEDCSDQPGQVGMWLDKDTGNWYLELGEAVTYLVVDDTAR